MTKRTVPMLMLLGAIALFGATVITGHANAEGQKPLELASKIDNAVVYPDRALVTRLAKLDNAAKGLYEIVINGLPVQIQDDSIRITSSDSNNLKIIGIDIKVYQLEKPPEDKIRELQEQLQRLLDNKRVIDDNLELLRLERAYLNSARDAFLKSALPLEQPSDAKVLTPPRLDVEDYDAMLKYYIEKIRVNNGAMQSKELELRELMKRISLTDGELSRIRGSQSSMPQKKSVRVNIEVLKEGSYDLMLGYINYGVSWQASYDIRILPDTKEMEITSYSVVFQGSGEDWLNTELSFSTAQPALQGWLSELPPLYVNVPAIRYFGKQLSDSNRQSLSQNFVGKSQAEAPANGMFAESESLDAKKEDASHGQAENQYLPAAASGSFGNVVFKTPKRVDIVSDGAPHRTALWQEKFPVSFEYITTPKLSPYVYLKAVGINKTKMPILRGNLNIFMGADFIGNSFTTGVLPDEEFELTLSVDENIRVTRKLEEKDEKGPGFLASTKKVTYSFMIKLENYKPGNALVTVIDQIPVSQNKDITVELDKVSDEPIEKGKDGKLKWKFDLKPKETKELTFVFSVYVPKDRDPAFSNAPIDQSENRKAGMQQKLKK
ncbi:MAG: mucoidy inhibitor MuiA family protein [Planctomycetota bacterium]